MSGGAGGLFVPCRKGSAVPFITAEQKSRYDKTFLSLLGATTRTPNQMLGGEKVKEVFLKSGLPAKTLGLIWEKSDLTKDGKLCEKEFAIAMCLIEHVLGGQTVPPTLPQQLISCDVNIPSTSVTSQAAPAPGGPPPQSQFTVHQDPFGGFGNSFIPGAPVARTGFPSAPPMLPPHPNNTIDAAFGGVAAPKLYPTLPPVPPVVPMRNDMKAMTLSGASMQMPTVPSSAGAPTGFDPFQTGAQPVPPRRDSLALNSNAASADWLVPPASRNKYRQQFSLNDPGRTGIMGANLARNILLQTNVDTNILARIWDLSNLRGQGNLNPDEFTLAMHLCDLVKAGESLPPTLPPLLIPPSMRDQKMNPPVVAPDAPSTTSEQPPQKQPMPVSFEDKLRQNFDRGEAALEEKRKALMEQERREKEERMMKERQEEERRARERAEQERKKAEQWAEQQRRIEEARKEAEAKAQAEHDRRVALTLESRIASARSQMTQLRSQNSQLDSDIQVLAAKKRSLDEQLQETKSSEQSCRNSVHERSEKYAARKKDLEQLQQQLQEFQRSLKQYTDKRISIAEQLKQQSTRNPIAERHSQVMASLDAQKRKVERLRAHILSAEKETADKFHRIDQLNAQITHCKQLLEKPAAPPASTTHSNKKRDSLSERKHSAETKWATGDPFADAFGGAPSGGSVISNGTGGSDPFADDLFKAAVKSSDPFSSAAVTSSTDPFSATTISHDLFSNSSSNNTFGTGGNNQTSFNSATTAAKDVKATTVAPVTLSQGETATSSGSASNGGSEVYFEALYDFASTDEGDLPFKAGDIIAASAEQNLQEAWLAGFLNGVGGWFPQNYTRRLQQQNKPAGSTSQQQENNSSVKHPGTDNTDSSNNFNHTQISSPSSSTSQILCKVRALYPFEAAAEGDLGLTAGDEVQVTCKDGDWWTGFLSSDPNHTPGIFPSNFVEVIQSFPPPSSQPMMATSGASASSSCAPQTLTLPGGGATDSASSGGKELASVIAEFHGDSPEQLNLSVGDVIIVKKKLDSGWWEGQIQGEKRKGWFPGDYVRLISSGLTPLASANSSPERKVSGASNTTAASGAAAERVRAQFAFTAERDDELTFNVGDVINILSKDDPDWWKGELRGNQGLFPSNFVSPL